MVKLCDLTYKEFLDKVGNLGRGVYYNDLYETLKEKVLCEDISTYSEFTAKCGNLGSLSYWDLYARLYSENKNAKGGKRHSKKTRKARKTRKGTYRRRR
jgi:hypothetical protein